MKHTWIITGWTRGPDGRWIETGHVKALRCSSASIAPELTIDRVSNFINSLEAVIIELQRRIYVDENFRRQHGETKDNPR
jgi:hypothetical protein